MGASIRSCSFFSTALTYRGAVAQNPKAMGGPIIGFPLKKKLELILMGCWPISGLHRASMFAMLWVGRRCGQKMQQPDPIDHFTDPAIASDHSRCVKFGTWTRVTRTLPRFAHGIVCIQFATNPARYLWNLQILAYVTNHHGSCPQLPWSLSSQRTSGGRLLSGGGAEVAFAPSALPPAPAWNQLVGRWARAARAASHWSKCQKLSLGSKCWGCVLKLGPDVIWCAI